MRKWLLGIMAAVAVAVVAGGTVFLLDREAPFLLFAASWGVLSFLTGAAGSEHYTGGPTPRELGLPT